MGKYSGKVVDQLLMDKPVGSKNLSWSANFEGRSVILRHFPASFFHHQYTGRCVPGIQIELPVAVEAAAGSIGKIQSGLTGTTDTVRVQGNLVIEVNVRVLVAFLARKTSCNQALADRLRARHVDRCPVEL